MRFGPPRFDDAEVIVPPKGISTSLQLPLDLALITESESPSFSKR